MFAGAQTGSVASPRASGATLFAEKGCAHCHGEYAEGGEKGPDLRNVRHRLTAKQIRHQIVAGGDSMPAFGDVLSEAEVTRLIAFLRSQRPPRTQP